MWVDDAIDELNRKEWEQEKRERRLPHCDYCDCVIYEEYYAINGEILCEECLNDNFKFEVEEE
jgi:formylmethanofuran dehydrogenase subunit E